MNGKASQVHGSEDLVLLRVHYFQIDLYIQCMYVKIPASFFAEIDKWILKFWKFSGQSIAMTILKKNNKIRRHVFLFEYLLQSDGNQDCVVLA